ncbi:MAG: DUF4352 domain-containing protein [Deltaproteobacteria bacterium]|nr:DUF4352 domain-containing protein [Deltaproteobacteria bacterium]
MNKKKLIIILVIVIFAIIIVAAIAGQSNNSQNEGQSKNVNIKKKIIYHIGDTVHLGKFSFKLKSSKVTDSVGAYGFESNAQKGNIYIAIVWKYTNLSKKPVSAFSVPSVHLINNKGDVYSSDIGATSSYATEIHGETNVISNINPGVSYTGIKVFEISKDYLNKNKWFIKVKNNGSKALFEISVFNDNSSK